jgi:hypothetical protein
VDASSSTGQSAPRAAPHGAAWDSRTSAREWKELNWGAGVDEQDANTAPNLRAAAAGSLRSPDLCSYEEPIAAVSGNRVEWGSARPNPHDKETDNLINQQKLQQVESESAHGVSRIGVPARSTDPGAE